MVPSWALMLTNARSVANRLTFPAYSHFPMALSLRGACSLGSRYKIAATAVNDSWKPAVNWLRGSTKTLMIAAAARIFQVLGRRCKARPHRYSPAMRAARTTLGGAPVSRT